MNKSYDVTIVGAGLVGLATGMRLLEKNPRLKLLILEKEDAVAKQQIGRNSGVIHSGIYYKPGSLKALNCRAGYEKLLKFCQEENIAHEICGKLVVASSESEIPALRELERRGLANGLSGLQWLSAEQIKEKEPYCLGVAALWVPQTGIVDYRAVAEKYAQRFQKLGGQLELNQKVSSLSDITLFSKKVINCAGVYSDRLAGKSLVKIIPFRGEYYQLKKSAQHLVKNLIYPVPDPRFPFLGVHFTRMMRGGVECGPNAVWAMGREAYDWRSISLRDTFEALAWPGFRKIMRQHWRMGLGELQRSWSKKAFARALQKLVPALKSEDLEPAGAGIRAQACDRDGNFLDDFDVRVHDNVIHVCNAPSPAATASLAIAEKIIEHWGTI
jgi:L-2-hydroxyglutarate oxidase